jgi:hypothetical protein
MAKASVPSAFYIPEQYRVSSLLTPEGYAPKTDKGRARGYSTAIMYFAPNKVSGKQFCGAWATPGCIFSCLDEAGHGGMWRKDGRNTVREARIKRNRWFTEDRDAFLARMLHEIKLAIGRARRKGNTPTVRLNGTSDLPWEKIKMPDGRTVFEHHPDVQFYDYTKNPNRMLAFCRGELPANYHLTFSRSELNEDDCRRVLAAGGNVAVPFLLKKNAAKPAMFYGAPVIDGDHDDLRFLDQPSVVVGLTAKGRKAKRDTSGFIVRMPVAA